MKCSIATPHFDPSKIALSNIKQGFIPWGSLGITQIKSFELLMIYFLNSWKTSDNKCSFLLSFIQKLFADWPETFCSDIWSFWKMIFVKFMGHKIFTFNVIFITFSLWNLPESGYVFFQNVISHAQSFCSPPRIQKMYVS